MVHCDVLRERSEPFAEGDRRLLEGEAEAAA